MSLKKRIAVEVLQPVHRSRIMVLALVGFLASYAAAYACNVPVFRYALERWQPDPYRVTLFHRGALTVEQRALVQPLEVPASGKRSVNVVLRVVDVEEMPEDADRALFAAQSPSELPWLVVQYPKGLKNDKPVRVGLLNQDMVTGLIESPLRSELIRRLADGQTAVWLMLECGQPEKDDATAARLADELKQLSEKLQLPELTSAPEDNLLSDVPLQVTFSLLRVPRDAAAEKPLIEMLLGSEADLLDFDEPMIFPVFGRGRALLPLIGAGITADNIHESAAFLVGACSCEIKELNPGFDLLLSAAWDVLFFKEAAASDLPTEQTSNPGGRVELVAIPAGATSTAAAATESGDLDQVAAVFPVGIVLASLVVVGLLFVLVATTLKRSA